MKPIIGFVSLFRRSWSVAAALSTIVMFAAPANAQISRLGSTVSLGGGAVTRGTDVGFDPVNNVYVAVGSTNSGSIRVVVTNTSAAVLQNYVLFVGNDAAGRYGQFPRVEYAPQANNGAGGQGAHGGRGGRVGAAQQRGPAAQQRQHHPGP